MLSLTPSPIESDNRQFMIQRPFTHGADMEDIHIQVPQNSTHYQITWSSASEKGYQFVGTKEQIHPELEDYSWPSKEDPQNQTKTGARLFLLADGHGGFEAAHFFVNRAKELLTSLIDSKQWDLDKEQEQLRHHLQQAFLTMDQEYIQFKIEQYKQWKQGGCKPKDEGCTFVVNILIKDYLISCNVGDSRTVVAIKDSNSSFNPYLVKRELHRSLSSPDMKKPFEPALLFISDDHNMYHGSKLQRILQNGGKFLMYPNTFIDDRLVPPHGSTSIPSTPTWYKGGEGIHPILMSRIYRPSSPLLQQLGVSHRRTLNLSATMGDLLFKVEPAVLDCVPDISFVKLPKLQGDSIVLLMATDGLWDHLIARESHQQCSTVMQWISSHLHDPSQEQLDLITKTLVTRVIDDDDRFHRCHSVPEFGNDQHIKFDMFALDHWRYDDAMAFVVLIE